MKKVLFLIAGVVLATSCTPRIQQSSRKGFLTMEELPNAISSASPTYVWCCL